MGNRLNLSLCLMLFLTVVGCGGESAPPAAQSICTPFEKSCSDGVPQECNAIGTGFITGDPCEANEVCDEGECVAESTSGGGGESSEGGGQGDAEDSDSDAEDGCSLNSDCEEQFGDNPCVTATCNKGECLTEPVTDGEACEDGICLEGACVPVICEVGELVCADVAGKSGGGLFACNALGTEFVKDADCDDGDSCNGIESCVDGTCVEGEALDCVDDNPCTKDDCDKLQGCAFEPITGPCDDGSACTIGDGCIGGSCVGGVGLSCEDNDRCTVDSCDPEIGCLNDAIPEGDPCDDGNACTVGESCIEQVCQGGEPMDCEGDNPDQCLVYSCDPDPVNGGCKEPANQLNGVGCFDGLNCTVTDVCQDGECTGKDVVCDDGDQCTVDSCTEEAGCVSEQVDGLDCEDGDDCTIGDSCLAGSCESGALVATNDCGMPINASCMISGAAGDEYVCSIVVARKHSAVPDVTGIQFDLSYSADQLAVSALEEDVCAGEACEAVPLPESPLSTGHSVGLNPATVEEWVTGGKVLIFLSTAPTALSSAYMSVGGDVIGDGYIFDVIVELKEDIPDSAPAFLYFDDIYAATSEADFMKTSMVNGVIIVNLAIE